MDSLKEIQTSLKSDFWILSETIKLLLSDDKERYEKIVLLLDKLQYKKVEQTIENLKTLSATPDFSKLIKIESDIDKIRKNHFEISIMLSKIKIKKTKSIEKEERNIVKKYVFPSKHIVPWNDYFLKIKDEHIPIILGKRENEFDVSDLAKMPHLLIAGETGSGKSVFLNTLITTILYTKTPEQCKIAIIDPKRVEFSLYKKVPHLWEPIVTDINDAGVLLDKLVTEMDVRYKELAKFEVKTIEAYNEKASHKKPYIVVIIDEFGNLILSSGQKVMNDIIQLASLARAAGIHIVMATQKPVVKIVEGLIKSNMPARIAFRVSTSQDSRIILDTNGAEKLDGCGDMLISEKGHIKRCQGAYISDEQIKQVVASIS